MNNMIKRGPITLPCTTPLVRRVTLESEVATLVCYDILDAGLKFHMIVTSMLFTLLVVCGIWLCVDEGGKAT